MSAEHLSASFVNQLTLSGVQHLPQGYYRSKLFTAPFSTNPIVAAAGPLLSLLERLGITPSLPAIHSIRDNIEHELCAFHSRLSKKLYTEELDAIAHYLLCATIDELLGKNYLRLYGEIAPFKAFTPSSYHDDGGPQQHFFEIVNHIKERANQYLDLLELAYYCLIAGFEGEQHGRADGRQVLDNLIEELYQLIQAHRVHKPQKLFEEEHPIGTFPKKYGSMIAMGIVTLTILISGYLGSQFMLKNQIKTIQMGHSVIAKLDN